MTEQFVPEDTEMVAYEKPTIVDYGDLKEMTRATSGSSQVDATYTTGQTATFFSHPVA